MVRPLETRFGVSVKVSKPATPSAACGPGCARMDPASVNGCGGYGGDNRTPREVIWRRDTKGSERPTGAIAPTVTMPAWSAAPYRESA